MLLPDKHISLAESILGLGAFLLGELSAPTSVDKLYQRVCKAREAQELPAYHDFDAVMLALTFLFVVGLIEQTDTGGVQRCAS